jgi:hypothetical protein
VILIVLTALALLLAVLGRMFIRHTTVLLGLIVLQAVLGTLGSDTQAWFGALHAVNALAVMAAAGTLARSSVTTGRGRWGVRTVPDGAQQFGES